MIEVPFFGSLMKSLRRFWLTARFAVLSLIGGSQHVTPAIERLCRKEIDSGNAGQLPRFLLAHALAEDSRFVEAREEFRLLIDGGDSRDSVLQKAGEVCYRLADFGNAVHYLKWVSATSANTRTFEFLLGMSLLGLRDYAAALPHLQACENTDVRDAAIANGIAYCLFNLGDVEGAVVWYRKALERDPISLTIREDAARAFGHLANNQIKDHLREGAIENFYAALRLRPSEGVTKVISETLQALGENIRTGSDSH
jgi:tetratricopeptide (TPR) repeat protein